jgi:hypothetical protein
MSYYSVEIYRQVKRSNLWTSVNDQHKWKTGISSTTLIGRSLQLYWWKVHHVDEVTSLVSIFIFSGKIILCCLV